MGALIGAVRLSSKRIVTSRFHDSAGCRIALPIENLHRSRVAIHVIDSVLLPPSKDIIDTAVEAGSFKTLAAALKAAELIETLKGNGPFTVFALTDEPCAKLPEGTVESLLKPEITHGENGHARKTQEMLRYTIPFGLVVITNHLSRLHGIQK